MWSWEQTPSEGKEATLQYSQPSGQLSAGWPFEIVYFEAKGLVGLYLPSSLPSPSLPAIWMCNTSYSPTPGITLGKAPPFGQGQCSKESAMSLSSWGHLGDVVQCPL